MYLAQPTGLHLVDETAHVVLMGYERARLYPPDRLAHVLFQVAKSLQGEPRLDPRLLLNLPLHLVVGDGQHPAVREVDEDYLARPEQTLRDNQRADLIVCDHPASRITRASPFRSPSIS